jgi:hypothetical protein
VAMEWLPLAPTAYPRGMISRLEGEVQYRV